MHSLQASNDHYKGVEIVKIDFPETLAVCIFYRMMNKNAYIIILFCHCFHGNIFFYLKHIFCFFKLKIACFELAIAKTLYKEYYMHFIDHSTEETNRQRFRKIYFNYSRPS